MNFLFRINFFVIFKLKIVTSEKKSTWYFVFSHVRFQLNLAPNPKTAQPTTYSTDKETNEDKIHCPKVLLSWSMDNKKEIHSCVREICPKSWKNQNQKTFLCACVMRKTKETKSRADYKLDFPSDIFSHVDSMENFQKMFSTLCCSIFMT